VLIAAIIFVSFCMGWISLVLLIRHVLSHAAKCDEHKERFWNMGEKKYPGLLKGQVEREGIVVCPNCGKEVPPLPEGAKA
jgi:hypothetical protein